MTTRVASHPSFLREHGFWDYTTPGTGGLEGFSRDDYARLLDDMAAGGMNSLLVCVKWFTTGYRSKLPFLDQHASLCTAIATDNDLLQWTIREAAARGIKFWLSAVVSFHCVRPFGGSPLHTFDSACGFKLPEAIGLYDMDSPAFTERAVAVFEELVDLFPGTGGLMVEVEDSGRECPHRIGPYNAWAEATGAPPFEKLGHPLNPRGWDYTFSPWRDYTTHRRLELMRTIEQAVRARGFGGEMAMICETGVTDYETCQEVNLRIFHEQLPDWIGLTYEYDKYRRRYGMMDACIDQPKSLGLRTYYLPRGVMTWNGEWPMPIPLEESWRMDVEDIRQFKPDGVWWFGCGTLGRGCHADQARLLQSGFADGLAARRALLEMAKPLRTR